MRLLLDTHAALFWWTAASRLGEQARNVIGEADAIAVSAASAWEIATKHRLGKLGDIGDPAAHFRRLMARNGFEDLPVTTEHALRAGALPGPHRNPFDRIIAAQALVEGLTVITRDKQIAAFGCEVIW